MDEEKSDERRRAESVRLSAGIGDTGWTETRFTINKQQKCLICSFVP